MRKIPLSVLTVALVLAALRMLAFLYIDSGVRHDIAQWQLSYVPLFIADLPVSFVYSFLRVPSALFQSIIGTVWWFILPIVVWRLFLLTRRKPKLNDA